MTLTGVTEPGSHSAPAQPTRRAQFPSALSKFVPIMRYEGFADVSRDVIAGSAIISSEKEEASVTSREGHTDHRSAR